MSDIDSLQYPIGRFVWQTQLDIENRTKALKSLIAFPEQLEALMDTFPESLLTKRYRPEGWTAIQVIHHLADSHMHSFLRCKHALLEDIPHIKDYHENNWAHTTDGIFSNVRVSVALLKALHQRWALFFQSLSEEDFQRSYFHPEREKHYPLDTVLALYAWHGEHHLAHLQSILQNPFE